MASDLDLIRAITEGDGRAFDELLARHCEPVRLRLARIIRDQEAVEDLLQEVFLRLWTKAEQWNGTGSLEHWLIKVATNLALNHLRSRRRHPEVPLQSAADTDHEGESELSASSLESSSAGPADLFEQAEQAHLLRTIMRTLPDAQREVMQLVLDKQLAIGEIASTLGVAPGTVKSRLHYARQSIDRQWPGEDR